MGVMKLNVGARHMAFHAQPANVSVAHHLVLAMF